MVQPVEVTGVKALDLVREHHLDELPKAGASHIVATTTASNPLDVVSAKIFDFHDVSVCSVGIPECQALKPPIILEELRALRFCHQCSFHVF